ncbi:isoleucine--tRNA ligase [Gleimia hominis]|uniref:isoleucine--tRNA ligase n=1 Tax=Gleimia hominis TaxID=595468 RepID=UPI000C7F9B91|nr:isoleucine--tRNA ligase [Gleimia hominis]WIK65332.1 isoleucine--tRNA ligase [Gleimia hominis]
MSEKNYPLHRSGDVEASPFFPDVERDVLAYWKTDDTFKKSIAQRPAGKNGDNEFVFYDGPPFANGLPHYGHLLTGYVKDIVGRYQTMQGRHVERRFGWDTHGLPAELEAERILGIEDKSQIEGEGGIGIAAFNDACRSSVLRYTDEWEEYVTRQARWVDFENDYKTLDPTYMESVIWAFKTLWDKGLVYEGYRVLPYCWNDETPLSNHELKMDDDVYQDRQDNTLTVGMRLETGELALIWTTTPWTLPSNLAIAVDPNTDYVTVEPTEGELVGEKVVLAQALVDRYAAELGEDPRVVATYKGSDLVGRAYTPIFDYFVGRGKDEAPGENAWHVIAADFVTTEDGTGLVHIAPAFGEDDMNVCVENNIRAVVPVDEAGKFTAEVPDYEGLQVFDANKPITRDLRRGWEEDEGPVARTPRSERARLVRQQSFAHSYPHCWRCRKPLIYRAVSSWFVQVTAFRDRMVELNEQINWCPAHIKHGQFGKWLEGARDWSISRNRFWGSPIPVWKSDNPDYPRIDVYGSFEELERDFGVKVDNLHRPFIDSLTRPNPDDPTGQSTMRRIPDVLDCWFDSGSMPFAQVHYPFENEDWFEDHYPGDFIVEYIGQTRGWFYTLHVLATALFDRPAFNNCVSHGIVLGDDGRKMSKSLRNYPDVNGVFNDYGSDAMRWFLMSSNVVNGGNLVVTERGIRDTVRQIVLPMWNAYYFFALYAKTCAKGSGYLATAIAPDDEARVKALPVMDQYLLARTRQLAIEVEAAQNRFDIPGACELVRAHLDLLTNWYVRVSRQRFWDEDHDAFDTLYTALEVLMRVSAPLLPLVTEEIWRGLTGGESVHLTDYPHIGQAWANDELLQTMNEVRDVVSGGHSLRKAEQIRVRQPLRSLTVVSPLAQNLEAYKHLIASEVNVKNVRLSAPDTSGLETRQELTLNPRAFDPAVRRYTSKLFAAQKQGQWQAEDGSVVFPTVLVEGEPVRLSGDQVKLATVVQAEEGQSATVLGSGSFVVLDTQLDEELKAEGYARDLVRAIQDARKQAGLDISDRINLTLQVPNEHVAAARTHADMIAHEVLALETHITGGVDEVKIEVTKRS